MKPIMFLITAANVSVCCLMVLATSPSRQDDGGLEPGLAQLAVRERLAGLPLAAASSSNLRLDKT